MLRVKVDIGNKGEMEESVSCLISVTVCLEFHLVQRIFPSDLIWE